MDKKKLLIIDDEKSICMLVKMNLEQTGQYEVTEAYSGEEGILKAAENDFDIVLTDYKMPGMKGDEVSEKLKSMKPDSPVVLISVYHDDPSTITSKTLNRVDGLISKPFEKNQLIETINKVLSAPKKKNSSLLANGAKELDYKE